MKNHLNRFLTVSILSLIMTLGGFSYALADTLSTFLAVPDTSGSDTFGQSDSIGSQAILYKPAASHNICSATIKVKALSTSVTDAVQMDIYRDTSQSPGSAFNFTTPTYPSQAVYPDTTGTLLQSADTHFQIRSTSLQSTTFTFTPCVTVVGGYSYWFKISRDGALQTSASNLYYQTSGHLDGSGSYAFTGVEDANNWMYAHMVCGGGSCGGVPASPVYPGSHQMTSISLNGVQNYAAYSPSSTPALAQSVINEVLGINDGNAPTSIASSSPRFWSLQTYLNSKFPFNYGFAILSGFQVLSYGTTTTNYAFDMTFTGNLVHTSTSSPLAIMPSTWGVIDSTSMSTYYPDTTRIFFRTLLLAVVSVSWGFAMFYRVKLAFS